MTSWPAQASDPSMAQKFAGLDAPEPYTLGRAPDLMHAEEGRGSAGCCCHAVRLCVRVFASPALVHWTRDLA